LKAIQALAAILIGLAFPQAALAQQQLGAPVNPNPIFAVPQGVTFLTGDSWDQGGTVVRLYGVQSCIRGTSIHTSGAVTDCGEISMLFLANFLKNAPTSCQGLGTTQAPAQYLVVCKSQIGRQTVDLGTALIVKGFAFASVDSANQPITYQYAVAEEEARTHKSGLWAFQKFPHPNSLMREALKAVTKGAGP
jgi:endonuclease YncB( thermonuclease family)